jgi:uncharacterized membrane protein YedE/YeeE
MKRNAAAFGAGALFAVGLALSGMTRPAKVVGFLDLAGDWDASLAFVMMGAIAVHFVAYRVVLRRPAPLFDVRFHLPTRKDIDLRLVLGAALFGVGWGLGGFCPGPGITSLVGGAAPVAFFVLAMLVGIAVTARLEDSAKPVVDVARTPGAR